MTTTAQNVRTSAVWPVLFGVAVLAGVTAAGLGAMSLADALTATGLPDPGPVTTYGLPFVRAAGEIAAVVAVGSFMFAAFMVPPQQNGVLDADGYRALRTGHRRVGDLDGVRGAAGAADRLRRHRSAAVRRACSPADIWSVAGLVETAGAWRWTAFLAAIVDGREHPGAALVADAGAVRRVAGDAAPACADRTFVVGRLARPGHQQPAHPFDRRRAVGGRPAGAARPCAARGGHADLAARRFSAVALWCFVAMALSGVVNALVRIRSRRPVRHRLRPAGRRQGRRAVHAGRDRLAAAAQRRRRAAVRPAGARPADPAGDDRGGGLRADVRHRRRAGPDTRRRRRRSSTRRSPRSRSATTSPGRRPSPACCSTGASTSSSAPRRSCSPLVYLAGVITTASARRRVADGSDRRLAARLRWCCCSRRRRVSGRYMPAMFSMHMAAHMLLSMLTPILLVLGAPVTLALRALPAAGKGDPPGPREWLLAALHIAGVAVLHQPDRRDGDVRRRLLRPVLRRDLRRRRRQPRARTSR